MFQKYRKGKELSLSPHLFDISYCIVYYLFQKSFFKPGEEILG